MSRIKKINNVIRHTADKLDKGVALTPEETQYWAARLRLIADGCPPDLALDLRRRPGEKASDEAKRERISFVLHLVASLHQPFIDPRIPQAAQSLPLPLTEAINKVLPEVPQIMGDDCKYDFEQVRSWWYDKDKRHMRSPLRDTNDPDNPYHI